MRTFICIKCKEPCDLHEIDEGCYEEFWGAKVWHHQYTTMSDCCHSEYEEIVNGDKNTANI